MASIDLLQKLRTVTCNARQELQWLMEHVTGSRSFAPALNEEQNRTLKSLVDQRVQLRKPLQYLLETQPFGQLSLLVRPPTLIPRPETEEWTMKLIERLISSAKKRRGLGPIRVLDACCGSGNIGLAIAWQMGDDVQVEGVDVSKEAIDLAEENRVRIGNLANVRFIHTDVLTFEPPRDKYDLVVTNPPYIRAKDWETLDPEVRLWEDRKALVAGEDGLQIARALIGRMPDLLVNFQPHGVDKRLNEHMVMELGDEAQFEEMIQEAKRVGMTALTRRDLFGRLRYLVCRHIAANEEHHKVKQEGV